MVTHRTAITYGERWVVSTGRGGLRWVVLVLAITLVAITDYYCCWFILRATHCVYFLEENGITILTERVLIVGGPTDSNPARGEEGRGSERSHHGRARVKHA